jgi:predicted AlkP superfamily pyrophosphatase or phosphodiesterase
MNITRIRFFTIFILFLVISAYSCADNKADYALIITIDGLRPDAIEKADTPNLDSLINKGSYTPSAKTDQTAKTLPSHTSLVTGLTSKRHGMIDNVYTPELGHTKFETIFTIAKKRGLGTALFVGKKKLSYINVPGTVEHYESTDMSEDSVRQITQSYSSYLKEHKPGLTLIHFPFPDLTGHRKGWMSAEYLDSIGVVDKALGTIVESLKETGIFESTFIVITSDHGGEGNTHGRLVANSINIPWLAIGKNVKADYRIKEQVYIYDTAPTVLRALGLPSPANIDGSVIKEIFLNNLN